MFDAVAMGLTLGLAAGMAPGPLLAILIGETLSHGRRAGVLVALAPLFSDLPIVAGSLLAVGAVAADWRWLSLLSLVGGSYLVWTGSRSFLRELFPDPEPAGAAGSFQKAVTANLTNPHPWIFWFTVGAPLVLADNNPWAYGFAFIAVFYLLLVGSKLVVVVMTDYGRALMSAASLKRARAGLALAIVAVGIVLLVRGYSSLLS